MVKTIFFLPSVLYFLITSCRATKDSSKGIPNDNTLWKKEYEEELNDALSTRKNNYTRNIDLNSVDSDLVLEKLLESITSSEKYLKKVDNIQFRLNRMDVELHEKTNTIITHLSDLLKQNRAQTSGTGAFEHIETRMEFIKSELGNLKTLLEQRSASGGTEIDGGLEARLSGLENNIKTIQTGVDTVVNIISEVKNRRYPKTDRPRAESGNSLDALSLITEFKKTIMDQKKKCDCNKGGRVDRSERFPTDCYEIQKQGFNISGIYKIKPDDSDPFYVLCDLITAGGGWTVFQNRFDGSQDFYKGWSDYKHGFGNLAGEFWLGLEKLSYLTNQKLYELRVELESGPGQDAFSTYSVFTVGPEHESYRISTLGTYRGTAGDSLSYHAGQKFSTVDTDNDEWADGSCATEHGGAWWYKECDKSNLNGKYALSADEARGQTIYWITFKGPTTPLMKTKMMIRPLPATKPSEIDYGRKALGINQKLTDINNRERSLAAYKYNPPRTYALY